MVTGIGLGMARPIPATKPTGHPNASPRPTAYPVTSPNPATNPTACPVVCPLPTRTINPSKPPRGYYDVLKRQVRFLLPPGHRNKDSSLWRRRPRPPCHTPIPPKPAQLSEAQTKRGFLNGSIPSAAWDTACTSHAGMIGDPFIPTGQIFWSISAQLGGRGRQSCRCGMYMLCPMPLTGWSH